MTSAFHGCRPLASSLLRRMTVPSIVGVWKDIESPLVCRLVAAGRISRGTARNTGISVAFCARRADRTGPPMSSLPDMMHAVIVGNSTR